MDLTEQTFYIYAARYYDNPFCFNEQEFHDDLKKIGTIKRMIAWSNNGEKVNIRLLINNIVCFYNVFEHHAASELISLKMTDEHVPKMNAVLLFLSLPLLGDGQYDLLFHRQIAQEFKDR